MMLFTDRDEPTDWLRAGQALQRALLAATSMGVSASFLTQPLELADLAFQYDPRDSHASRLIGPSGRRGLPSLHRAVDASQRTSTSPIERRGYVRRRLLGATPWLEVPQMVIRVGYPQDGAEPDLRTPGPSRTSSTRAPIRRAAFRVPRPVTGQHGTGADGRPRRRDAPGRSPGGRPIPGIMARCISRRSRSGPSVMATARRSPGSWSNSGDRSCRSSTRAFSAPPTCPG